MRGTRNGDRAKLCATEKRNRSKGSWISTEIFTGRVIKLESTSKYGKNGKTNFGNRDYGMTVSSRPPAHSQRGDTFIELTNPSR